MVTAVTVTMWDGDDSCNFGSEQAGAGELTAYFDVRLMTGINMPDNLLTTDALLTEKNALANLCYDVGVACEMDYGACSSGAYMATATFAGSARILLLLRRQY